MAPDARRTWPVQPSLERSNAKMRGPWLACTNIYGMVVTIKVTYLCNKLWKVTFSVT